MYRFVDEWINSDLLIWWILLAVLIDRHWSFGWLIHLFDWFFSFLNNELCTTALSCREKWYSWIHTSCTRMRAYTLNRPYSQRTVLRAYTRVCARTYAQEFQTSWTFKAGIDISSNLMRLRGSRSTNGYRRHGNLHAYTRVCSYL